MVVQYTCDTNSAVTDMAMQVYFASFISKFVAFYIFTLYFKFNSIIFRSFVLARIFCSVNL
jgi:hypothetical protein